MWSFKSFEHCITIAKLLLHPLKSCELVAGLDYITEYSNPYQSYASFKCSLCDTFPQGMGIVTHIASQKHRLTYMVGIALTHCLLGNFS